MHKNITSFRDEEGRDWSIGVLRRDGPDYKGRYCLAFHREDEAARLTDVRWNSVDSAERTILTMSEGEMRRRLKVALGRAAPAPI